MGAAEVACRFQRRYLGHLLYDSWRMRRLLACVACQLLAILVFCRVMDGNALVIYIVFGGVLVPRMGSTPSVMSILAVLLLQAVAVLSFSDAVRPPLETMGPLTLPRAGSRARWTFRRIMAAAVAAAATAVLFTIETVAVAAFLSGPGVGQLVPAALLATFLQALMLAALVLIANAVSLAVDPILAGVAVAAIHVATLLAASFTSAQRPALLLALLPSIQGVPAWHDLSALGIPNLGSLGLSPWISFVYLLLLAIGAAGALVRIVSKIDIL